MELGGNAPCMVEDLVPDLEGTMAKLVHKGFYQSGQSCIHMQRLYVKGGDPRQDDMSIWPKSSAATVEKSVNETVKAGTKLLVGGKRRGAFMEPMILEDAPFDTDAKKEEIFSPVILLYSYNDFKEAVKEANNTHYGLQASVFIHDLNKAFYAFEHIEAGGVCLNDSPSMRVDSQPYGGIKDSGIQREGVKYVMDDMLETKVLVMCNVGNVAMALPCHGLEIGGDRFRERVAVLGVCNHGLNLTADCFSSMYLQGPGS
ncbi:hypothetical protein SELMODRAFT_412036 [Selaginella moellendorffii]|uniref:NADP-dependent glyceraldehyde-3-phosphate dehydrogenase n=1 Tax=Selaginella moellendorffii TaxID=88036 RepID=D8RJU6_SELML|nr:hypothetical protein SELMODRAFT_412036 [Selaginella moellendorffii]